MTYAVLDLETTIKQSYKRKANPFDEDNKVVLFGIKLKDDICHSHEKVNFNFLDLIDEKYTAWSNSELNYVSTKKQIQILVGHNIKFDLLYLWDYPRLQEWLLNGGKIFDTMVAQYILDAQKPESLSLDILAPKYGGTKKTGISKLIKGGKYKYFERKREFVGAFVHVRDHQQVLERVHLPRCPSELYKKYPKAMTRYLKGDLVNTEVVLLKQLQLLNKEGQLNLAKGMMDSVLATTEMEFNGIYVNREVHKQLKSEKIYEIADKLAELEKEVSVIWPSKHIKFNPASNDHISLLFFGGEAKYKIKKPVVDENTGLEVVIKTGKNAGSVKTKLCTDLCFFLPIIRPEKITKPVKKLGFYKVDDAVISILAKKKGRIGNIAKSLLSYRAANKELSTYYEGFEQCIQADSCIHGSLNQCVTGTGRLASSKPNMQNMPRKGTSKFKMIFTSRWGKEGVIIEADKKQLEVVGAAFLSGDETLKAEINSGVDMHYNNAEWVYKKPKEEVTDEERTLVKRQTFELLYGATPFGLAKSAGCSEEEAKEFIEGFYAKYKGIAAWHKQLEYTVYRNAKLPEQSNLRYSIYQNITGRKLKFTEVQKKNGSIEFNLPDIKNYPVQSFATGDIVPIQFGRLYRALLPHRSKVLLINTVHDSVLLDCKKEFALEACRIIKEVLEDSRWMKDLWNINFDLPLKVDISIGNSWYDLIKAEKYFENEQEVKYDRGKEVTSLHCA